MPEIDFEKEKTEFLKEHPQLTGEEDFEQRIDILAKEAEEFTKQKIAELEKELPLEKRNGLLKKPSSLPKLIRAKELVEFEYPETKWLVQDLIPAVGFTAITGAPYTYKSFITEHLAIAISMNQPLFGHFQVTQGAVLMIDKENSKNLLKERLLKLGFKDDPDIYFVDEPDKFQLSDKVVFEWTREFVAEKEIKLIVLDSFIHIHKGEENDSGAIAKTFEMLKGLGCAIVFIHHHRKTIKFFTGTVLESIRGSSDIGAELESHIALDSLNEKLRITQGKNRWGTLLPPFTVLPLITDSGAVFQYEGEIEDYKSKSEQARVAILTALEQTPEISRKIFIEMLSVSISQRVIVEQLKQLENDAIIGANIKNREKWYHLLDRSIVQTDMQSAQDEVSTLEQSFLEDE